MLTLLQKIKKSLLNVYRNFGLMQNSRMLWARIGVYHTQLLSCIVSCVSTSEQDVWRWWPWLTGRLL